MYTIPAFSLVNYNVIPLLIGQPAILPITSIMYHVGEGTRLVRSSSRATDMDGLSSPRATNIVVVINGWSLTTNDDLSIVTLSDGPKVNYLKPMWWV